jgi:hypothetical protein
MQSVKFSKKMKANVFTEYRGFALGFDNRRFLL